MPSAAFTSAFNCSRLAGSGSASSGERVIHPLPFRSPILTLGFRGMPALSMANASANACCSSGDEGLDIQRLVQVGIIRLPLLGKIGGHILIRIAVAICVFHPNFFAA